MRAADCLLLRPNDLVLMRGRPGKVLEVIVGEDVNDPLIHVHQKFYDDKVQYEFFDYAHPEELEDTEYRITWFDKSVRRDHWFWGLFR